MDDKEKTKIADAAKRYIDNTLAIVAKDGISIMNISESLKYVGDSSTMDPAVQEAFAECVGKELNKNEQLLLFCSESMVFLLKADRKHCLKTVLCQDTLKQKSFEMHVLIWDKYTKVVYYVDNNEVSTPYETFGEAEKAYNAII